MTASIKKLAEKRREEILKDYSLIRGAEVNNIESQKRDSIPLNRLNIIAGHLQIHFDYFQGRQCSEIESKDLLALNDPKKMKEYVEKSVAIFATIFAHNFPWDAIKPYNLDKETETELFDNTKSTLFKLLNFSSQYKKEYRGIDKEDLSFLSIVLRLNNLEAKIEHLIQQNIKDNKALKLFDCFIKLIGKDNIISALEKYQFSEEFIQQEKKSFAEIVGKYHSVSEHRSSFLAKRIAGVKERKEQIYSKAGNVINQDDSGAQRSSSL